jgi:hypothetical protein
LLDELGNQPRPACLVAGSQAGAVVPVKILVKGDVVAPVRVRLETLVAAKDGTAAIRAAQENVDEAA